MGTKVQLADEKMRRTSIKKKKGPAACARSARASLEQVIRLAEEEKGIKLGMIRTRNRAWYDE